MFFHKAASPLGNQTRNKFKPEIQQAS